VLLIGIDYLGEEGFVPLGHALGLSVQFEDLGLYELRCVIHPGLEGTGWVYSLPERLAEGLGVPPIPLLVE